MYHYFDSKDDLLHEIYGRVLRMQMERLNRFADAQGRWPSACTPPPPTS